jgi:DNA-binding NarL/FixJ family response regulator
MALRILIVDDHRLFRQGLVSLMRTRQELVEIVGEAATGTQALEMVHRVKPDVILMDIQLPDISGLDVAANVRQHLSSAAIVMLTASETDQDLCRAMELGVSGYLPKSLDADELFHLLEGVQNGEPAITPSMAMRLMKLMRSPVNTDPIHEQAGTDLTEREMDVLRGVVKGFSNPKIADDLCISINTVKAHLHNILEKLRVTNRAQAAVCAVQQGLIEEDTVRASNGRYFN